MSNNPSASTQVDLPYFDDVLADLPKVDPELRKVLSRHAHWGYWENPASAAYTLESLAFAQEELSKQVADAGQVRSGQRVLDCGCGFGGTIANLNDRLQDLDMVGLNIDPRQLEVARINFQAKNGNRAEFIEGDACVLPFEDNSFDRVLAVECVFHFPSRQQFFQEVHLVLQPGVAERGPRAQPGGESGLGGRVHHVGGGVEVDAVAFVDLAVLGNQPGKCAGDRIGRASRNSGQHFGLTPASLNR